MPPRNPTDNFMTADIQTIFTIGVYGSSEESFFGALEENEIELFIDIRARRGMRGSKYRYANSSYLQSKLKELGIHYAHLKELAPTDEIRARQRGADKEGGTTKRGRSGLSQAFVKAYKRDILKVYKRNPENKIFADDMLATAQRLAGYPLGEQLRNVALFCVEQHPEACHRSLVAADWKRQLGIEIEHLKA